jgi:DNA repair protein RecO (recombination protein O)
MLHKNRGIILKLTSFSDKQKIVRVFTEDFGARSMLFHTGGKNGKALLSLMQPMQHCDLLFFSKSEGMDSLRQASPVWVYTNLTRDPIKRLQALFLSEVLYRCLHHHGEDAELYRFTLSSLCALDEGTSSHPDDHLFWLMEFCRRLGFYPENNFDAHNKYFSPQDGCFVSAFPAGKGIPNSEKESYLLHTLITQGSIPSVSREERNNLLTLILSHYAAHVPSWRDLKSPEILSELLS